MREADWQAELLAAISAPQWDAHPALPAAALAVYRNNYRLGLIDTLKMIYPVLVTLLGDECFTELARDYVRATPSHSGNLHHYGAGLAEFVEQCAPLVQLPYLGDVARVEWAVHRGYYAADHTPFSIAELAALPQPEWPQLQLKLPASATRLDLAHAAASIWLAHQQQPVELGHIDPTQPEQLLVYRVAGQMRVRMLDAGEACWLAALAAGQMLEAACDSALAHDADFNLEPIWLALLQDGLFTQQKESPCAR